MKVTKVESRATHERIVQEAARGYRAKGFDGIGVADLMKRLGLTHGGFYTHFSSKEELMAEACKQAVDTMLVKWERVAGEGGQLNALVAYYLSERHRDQPENGCLLASLGPEISRQPMAVRKTVTECFGTVIEFLTRIAPGRNSATKRKRAIATFAGMLGALVIARALNDPALSEEVMGIVANAVKGTRAP